jgi:hypothetical protein
MSKAYHSAFGGGSVYRSEMAPFSTSNKTDGNDNPSNKVRPYQVKIDFDGNEYYTRIDGPGGRSWNFRALSFSALRRQVSLTLPNFRFQYSLSRSAELAHYGAAAAAMPGRG